MSEQGTPTITEQAQGQGTEFANEPGHKRPFVSKWQGKFVPSLTGNSLHEVLLYVDPLTFQEYRFSLHRKNHQKPDKYACSKCKSRRKFVRTLVTGVFFHEDPAALPHVCQMSVSEFRSKKTQEEVSQPHQVTFRPQTSSPIDVSGIEHETAAYPLEAISQLFESHDSTKLNLFQSSPSRFENLPSTSVVKIEEKNEIIDNSLPQDPNVQQLPTVHSTSSVAEMDSFTISLKRAISGLRPECRSKAENDILRFVYSTLYEKYADQ